MAKLYRCLVCEPTPHPDTGRMVAADFVADKPVCPKCGIDPQADPRDRGTIIELSVIHFDPPRRANRGQGFAACDSQLKVGFGGAFTGDLGTVNCPACQKSPAFLQLAKTVGFSIPHPAAEVEVIVNPTAGTIALKADPASQTLIPEAAAPPEVVSSGS